MVSLDLIQINYSELDNIANRFVQQADTIDVFQHSLKRCTNNLHGRWEGKGAEAFFSEMEMEIFPALHKLLVALQESNNTIQQIIKIFQDAEEKASTLFLIEQESYEYGNRNSPEKFLKEKGVEKLFNDSKKYKDGFPEDYYDEFSRYLFDELISQGYNRQEAFSTLFDLQNGGLGYDIQNEYTQIVGTDNLNGWDKVRHFLANAYLEDTGIPFSPEIFSYGKEIMDEIESWLGKDNEGYSIPDIQADNRGEAFAEEMAKLHP